MPITPSAERAAAQALGTAFDEAEVRAILEALKAITDFPQNATTTARGTVLRAAPVAAATVSTDATSVSTQFNALRTALINAGIGS